MSLISKNIPNLINGVSQQPPTLRLDSQAEEQINGLSDVVTGLRKRPPTEYVNTLTGDFTNSILHTYKRDENEQYTIMVKDGEVRIYDGIGSPIPVELAAGATYDYITNIVAETDIRVTSVADFSFILNTKKVVAKSSEIFPPVRTNEALVYLKQANYNRRYQVTIDPIDTGGTSFPSFVHTSTTAGSSSGINLRTDSVVEDLRINLGSNGVAVEEFSARSGDDYHDAGKYTLQQTTVDAYIANPSVLHVRVGSTLIPSTNWTINTTTNVLDFGRQYSVRDYGEYDTEAVAVYDSAFSSSGDAFITYPAAQSPFFIISNEELDFNIRVSDDTGGTTLKAFKGTAKSFTDLPNQCLDGFQLAVIGDNNKDEDNFHVKFEGDFGQGVWRETVAAGIQNKIDTSTMPHQLEKFISDGTDGYTLGQVFFKFGAAPWNDRVAGDDDTNPFPSFIGYTINDIFFHRNRLGVLADENVIFSESGAFYNFFRTTVRALLDSAPIDVAVSNSSVSILKAAIPFSEQLLLFSDLAQFNLSSGTLLTPTDVSVNVATNYEADLSVRPVSAGNSIFFGLDKGSALGVREYFVAGQTELNVAEDITGNIPTYIQGNITGMATSSTEDMLVITTDDNPQVIYVYRWYIANNEKVQSSWSKWDMAGNVLDMSFDNSELYLLTDYDGTVMLEKINLAEDTAVSVTDSKHPVLLDRRVKLESSADLASMPYSDSTLQYMTPAGKYVTSPTTYPVYAGIPYTFSYTFSEQVFRPDANKPVTIARYQLRNFNIVYSDTSTFDVTVAAVGRDPKVSTFTGNLLGSSSFVLGTANIVPNGTHKVGIQSQASAVDVTISSTSALPVNLTSVEIEGFVTFRSDRI